MMSTPVLGVNTHFGALDRLSNMAKQMRNEIKLQDKGCAAADKQES